MHLKYYKNKFSNSCQGHNTPKTCTEQNAGVYQAQEIVTIL